MRMKARSEILEVDGFDKNVAEKMPKMRKLEEPLRTNSEKEIQFPREIKEKIGDEEIERKNFIDFSKIETPLENDGEITRLIEDLHAQLIVSTQTKRALEMDLKSREKMINQLSQDNQNLRKQIEGLNEELKKLREIQVELAYLKEENADASDRIQQFQQELKELRETLEQTIKQRDDALGRVQELESKLESEELLKIKWKLKEREVSYFAEENQRLQSKLEEVVARNIDLEEKYNALRRSFNEVKESLTLLRDSCKRDYYNLSENI